jgi:hypothetical protein
MYHSPQQVLEKGTHFLQKPFFMDAIVKKVRDMLTCPLLKKCCPERLYAKALPH